jgi:hypothetical protein
MKAQPNRSGLVTINYCVSRYLNESGNFDPKPNEYKRLSQLAIDGFLDLNIWQPHSVKTTKLQVNEAFNAALPKDYVRYTKIGLNKGGRFYTLTKDDTILPANEYGPEGAIPLNRSPKQPDLPFLEEVTEFSGGQYVGGLYSQVGGVNENYYRVDRERGLIMLSNKIGKCELLLEYISTGITTNSDVIVPIECAATISAYMHKVIAENDPRVPMNMKMKRDDDYNRAYDKLLTVRTMFTMDEYLDMVYSTSHQSVKR